MFGYSSTKHPNPLWEMSSFSEASKAVALLVDMATDAPSSGASPLPQ
ncbi:hypothetical protein ALQ29_00211 [Pseudomonas marginalis pv. marginalis]|uniref:Uncharacterized protein n=1 Tax=Pseudomonas marginalis pv. marginalis TaxID=97473 RepID=A0A3M4A7N3_PSEMA|nr:hypothetical protein ALQ38_200049 [Pseudomonas marginalis pv. marginalis]RMP02420.1 hypothetical protein ALQ29_00211 [Pseudomonas marginalis pv. marginalis]